MKSPLIILASIFAISACATSHLSDEVAITSSESSFSTVEPAKDGYTYPAPQSGEPVQTLVQDTVAPPRAVRVQIATSILMMESQRPYAPSFFPITEGENADTLVLMDTGALGLDNPYKARAFVSVTTSMIRNNPLFLEHGVQNEASIFDMLKIWGFSRLIVTDGEDFSHVFEIQ
ncbi:MAG: hypothetical protein AAF583_00805 [Pseudomonadota bacterium]